MRRIEASRRSKAFDHARTAYELMVQGKQQAAAARRSRERARNVRRALVSCIVIGLFLGLAIYQDGMPTSIRPPASPRQTMADRFVETRTGLVRTPIKGNTCKELQFDNQIGRFISGRIVPCYDDGSASEDAQSPRPAPAGRVNSIRDTFAQ